MDNLGIVTYKAIYLFNTFYLFSVEKSRALDKIIIGRKVWYKENSAPQEKITIISIPPLSNDHNWFLSV